jgi:hypothetical protein
MSGIFDLDLYLAHRMPPLRSTQRICHQKQAQRDRVVSTANSDNAETGHHGLVLDMSDYACQALEPNRDRFELLNET